MSRSAECKNFSPAYLGVESSGNEDAILKHMPAKAAVMPKAVIAMGYMVEAGCRPAA